MKQVFVLGSINMDLVIHVGRIPERGETLHGEAFFTNGGGKGANQAVACAKQGVECYLVGAVGEDVFADGLLETLKAYQVRIPFVRKLPTSTGVAMILIEEGDNRIVLDGGANLCITKAQIDEALTHAKPGDYFVAQLENNVDAVHYGLAAAKAKGMITIFNPAPAARQPEEVYAFVDILVLNETECALLTGITPSDEAAMEQAYQKAAKWGIGCFILTLGARGSVCFTPEGRLPVAPNPVAAVDTTAAGDTFVGVLAAQLAQERMLPDALAYASVASSLTCCKRGAQCAIPTAEEIQSYLQSQAADTKA